MAADETCQDDGHMFSRGSRRTGNGWYTHTASSLSPVLLTSSLTNDFPHPFRLHVVPTDTGAAKSSSSSSGGRIGPSRETLAGKGADAIADAVYTSLPSVPSVTFNETFADDFGASTFGAALECNPVVHPFDPASEWQRRPVADVTYRDLHKLIEIKHRLVEVLTT